MIGKERKYTFTRDCKTSDAVIITYFKIMSGPPTIQDDEEKYFSV